MIVDELLKQDGNISSSLDDVTAADGATVAPVDQSGEVKALALRIQNETLDRYQELEVKIALVSGDFSSGAARPRWG